MNINIIFFQNWKRNENDLNRQKIEVIHMKQYPIILVYFSQTQFNKYHKLIFYLVIFDIHKN